MIPREIMGGRRRMPAMHVALNKKLQAEIVNQNKLPRIVVSVDASNCFDRVAHPTVGMACQHFGLSLDFVITFFGAIQNMKRHRMTAHVLLTNFYLVQDLLFL